MTILELLEAHMYDPSQLLGSIAGCSCGDWAVDLPIGQSKVKAHRAHVAEVLEAHQQQRETQLCQLVRDMTDPDPCWFDHHGGCQTHGYLDLKPGELCPHAEAKQIFKEQP